MFSSAQSSYPLSEARHPPALARSLDSSRGDRVQDAGSPWIPSSGSALQVQSTDPPCLSRSGQQIHNYSSAAHISSLSRTPSCSSAPATPRSGLITLPGPGGSHPHSRRHPHFALGTVPYHLHDSDRPAPVMSASLPTMATLPSLPPFAHPKLTALPAVNMEHDRLARACGQGPVFAMASDLASSSRPQESEVSESHRAGHSAKFADPSRRTAIPPTPLDLDDPVLGFPFGLGWGLRPRATSVRVPQRHAPSHLPSRPRSASQPASIPVFAPSSPRGVLRSLSEVLDLEGMQLEDCLDVHGVFERWETQCDRGLARGEAVHHKTFGSPVSTAVKCASMSTVLGGYQHDVPWVVYACVEELNRTGIYQQGLFRAVPNRARLARLVQAFDLPSPVHSSALDGDSTCPKMTPTPSSTRASLRKEAMPDICALLKTYLDLLPEPLLDANLTSALHMLCVQPCLAREYEVDDAGSDSDGGYFASHSRPRSVPPSASSPSRLPLEVPLTPSEHRHAQLSLEAPQILLAQHLLRLAPPPSLALLAYLLGFFTQLPLCPDNGMAFADVARMFGRVLVGGARADVQVVRECVAWLLERWGRISDGLFDVAPGSEGKEHEHAQSESAPASACKETFSTPVCSPPLSSQGATPRLAQGEPDGMARVQMPPYDLGLRLAGLRAQALRPHSTSVSSDGSSSATSASLDTEEAYYAAEDVAFDPGYSLSIPTRGVKDAVGTLPAVREYEPAYDPFDKGARVQPDFELVVAAERSDDVACVSSPRRYLAPPRGPTAEFGARLSPPTSVCSEVGARSWPSTSCPTSRCSPVPFDSSVAGSPHARGHSDSEVGSRSSVGARDMTPRNSANLASRE